MESCNISGSVSL